MHLSSWSRTEFLYCDNFPIENLTVEEAIGLYFILIITVWWSMGSKKSNWQRKIQSETKVYFEFLSPVEFFVLHCHSYRKTYSE